MFLFMCMCLCVSRHMSLYPWKIKTRCRSNFCLFYKVLVTFFSFPCAIQIKLAKQFCITRKRRRETEDYTPSLAPSNPCDLLTFNSTKWSVTFLISENYAWILKKRLLIKKIFTSTFLLLVSFLLLLFISIFTEKHKRSR